MPPAGADTASGATGTDPGPGAMDAAERVGDFATPPGSGDVSPAIRARGLCVTLGGRRVLDGVDLVVAPGERVALIGPNGAGKSTLLRALTGMVACEGTATVFGAPPGHALRKRMGMVFQHHALVARASALSNVVHGLMHRPGGWRAWHEGLAPASFRAAAMESLARVGLADRARTRAGDLSGGQAQRVAIARALVRAPDLLVADEPAASLDPAAGHEVMAALAETAGGRTLIFTSHDMGHARAYATRIVALDAGRVVFDVPAAATDPARLRALFAERAA